jgi:hemoglobin-like flavoprotein
MKLVLAVILSVCVAYAAAADCDGLQRFKVQHQWQESFGSGHHRVEFGVKLFNKLFHDHPETRAVFERVHGDNIYSPEFKAHAERVLGGLSMTIGLLDDPEAVKAQLAHLNEQHKPRGLKPEYFTYLGEELLDLLPEYLGSRLDYAAWKACYNKLVSAISA